MDETYFEHCFTLEGRGLLTDFYNNLFRRKKVTYRSKKKKKSSTIILIKATNFK